MRHALVIALPLAAALVVAGCGGGGGSTATGSTAGTTPAAEHTTSAPSLSGPAAPKSRGLTVRLKGPATPPRAGRGWPVHITARERDGQPVDGTVSYAFLVAGRVVARRPGGHMSGGSFRDSLVFPARATGIPLTLRVVLRSHGHTATADREVTVRAAGS